MARRYRVRITESAEADVELLHNYIARDNPLAALRWRRKILRLMQSLRIMPFRWEVIPEDLALDREYRHALLGNYRVIFRVEGDIARVIRVFHAARMLRCFDLRDDEPPSQTV